MEGIQKIAEKIVSDSKDEANAILTDAHSQKAQILLDAQKEAERQVLALKKKAGSEAAAMTGIMTSAAELEMRNKILSGKQLLIQEVFERVAENLRQLPPDHYHSMLQTLLIRAVETGTEEVVFSEKDKNDFAMAFVKETNERLILMGRTGQLAVSEETGVHLQGFVVKAAAYDMDYGFESIIKMARETLESKVVKILFE